LVFIELAMKTYWMDRRIWNTIRGTVVGVDMYLEKEYGLVCTVNTRQNRTNGELRIEYKYEVTDERRFTIFLLKWL
jgi:hypothetical protein